MGPQGGSCKEEERKGEEGKQSSFKGKWCGNCTFFSLVEFIGKNLDTEPASHTSKGGWKCSFHLSVYVPNRSVFTMEKWENKFEEATASLSYVPFIILQF